MGRKKERVSDWMYPTAEMRFSMALAFNEQLRATDPIPGYFLLRSISHIGMADRPEKCHEAPVNSNNDCSRVALMQSQLQA